jgi:hypothetical protein
MNMNEIVRVAKILLERTVICEKSITKVVDEIFCLDRYKFSYNKQYVLTELLKIFIVTED